MKKILSGMLLAVLCMMLVTSCERIWTAILHSMKTLQALY